MLCLGGKKILVDFTSVCIAGRMYKYNSMQQLPLYFKNSFRIEPFPFFMVVIHDYVDSRAKQFEYETLMTSIRTLMKEIVE